MEPTSSSSSFKFVFNSSSPLSLSPNFILPDDETVKPNLSQVLPSSTSIPTIDMNIDHNSLVTKISNACENYGFFQIINHGVSGDLYRQMMDVATNFFQLPHEERAKLYSEDRSVPVRVGGFHLKFQSQGKVNMWMEQLYHPVHPIEDYFHLLPENPPRYREVAAAYAKETVDLVYRLLGLISEGLELGTSYLQRRLGDKHECHQQVNFYPPCPDPELTLGLQVHTDIGMITILQQLEGVSGLQVIKDGKWLSVDPLPNAFIVNVADQLEVMSNGRYKSVHHRAVTNKEMPRISIATFCRPSKDAIIGPIEEMVSEEHPPIYRSYPYEEFFKEFCRQEGVRRRVKQVFQLNR
ncbi:Oxoglutarate/iron-dependent dioxygenase [Macleaya cordata]|uniref:Oxoglutarate/iron-dependent dioxygenase n=1 Tax=Macleaya cordata TaxID=56857 RepID=A0A200Q140_MACCD|nr:Oxoglutarate/iron-dependent dioxygenase [Macleaya cordata]